jgi:hypothetical protein
LFDRHSRVDDVIVLRRFAHVLPPPPPFPGSQTAMVVAPAEETAPVVADYFNDNQLLSRFSGVRVCSLQLHHYFCVTSWLFL